MDYFDHFTRPKQHHSKSNYENQLEASIEETEDNEASKYQTLFADAFGHHVQHNFDAESTIKLQFNNKRRFISNDSLTSYFLNELYTPPNIFNSQNYKPEPNSKRTFNFFLDCISDSPITKNGNNIDTQGSNQISFLIGNVGTGKTLLLSKAIQELRKRENLKVFKNIDDPVVLPVYFDFEKEMRIDKNKLLDIDDSFYGKLEAAILATIATVGYARNKITSTSSFYDKPDISKLAKLIERLRILHKDGIRILLVLDNLDGYHYHYSKYAFFGEYYEQQRDSIERNMTRLTTAFSHGEYLGNMGLSVVIAARRYVYKECLSLRNPIIAGEFSGKIYQLEDVDESQIVRSRLALFEAAISVMLTDPRLKKIAEDYRQTLSYLYVLFEIREIAQSDVSKPIGSVMRTLSGLCRYGNRDLVTFLSNLRFDYRNNAELIVRFFSDKPHTLILLYLANLQERYSQQHSHFPNLFLVDSLILRDPKFPSAHKPHNHTYWLKYLILSYVANSPDHVADVSRLRELFVNEGKFDNSLVRLTLGSLSTSYESYCLEPEPTEEIAYKSISTTKRGESLLSGWDGYKTPFCFSFTYLQLIVDDYLMSYPKVIWEKIYEKDTNLAYLFGDANTYGHTNSIYLTKKMHCVLAFIYLLRITLEFERKKILFYL